VVEGDRVVSGYEVLAVVVISVPFLYTRYPVTPALSVLAVHERLIWFAETAEAERFDGVEGAVVSPAGGGGVPPV